MKNWFFFSLPLLVLPFGGWAQTRTIHTLEQWKFHKGEVPEAKQIDFNDQAWENVIVPHDWAIYGPFDQEIDKQVVKIEQNNEEMATEKTGRTGALPFNGTGWYRTTIQLDDLQDKQILLTFDGAMSNAEVYVNGQKVGENAYGYSYFYFDVSDHLKAGEENLIAVRLHNLLYSSRWYPGAGLYRKVQLVVKDQIHFERWGHFITTPYIDDEVAKVKIQSRAMGSNLSVEVNIRDAEGKVVSQGSSDQFFGDQVELSLAVPQPQLWSPENPYRYTAELRLFQNGQLKDSEQIPFGIRSAEYIPGKGFVLNGQVTKFKGVCLHHDLGPLGTAINTAALRRQLTILKDMGCNAIRSAHNMPSLEQLELCDEMGFLFIAESFDEWKKPKVENGYNLYFDEWAEKDIVNLVRATRNHPSIVMWSAGNEVPDQWGSEGVKRARWIQDLFHREDPTRPVTVGMDQVEATMESGFGAILDIPGLNYRVHLYEKAFERFPQGLLLGSETASTVSSRGRYHFPVEQGPDRQHDDLHSSSYDLEYCNWSNIPEVDFEMQDDKDWVIGEFVWTGFDYLGEPTPYDDYWPSRSSYFGICDLAGLPKDRYYLYRSRWNTTEETLHILPHWNWEGREGERTPVFVYTNYPSAELFINGKSQGIRRKSKNSLLERYRLMWNEVVYEPGSLKVVAYDAEGNPVKEKEIYTAGKAKKLELSADRTRIQADGKDLAFITVKIVDKNGNLCPNAANDLKVQAKGAGTFRAICNGDPTSLELFHEPHMNAFSGQLVVVVQAAETPGPIYLSISGKGLKSGKLMIHCQ
ncbi:MAG: DUF4982 domain-containing protein [Bacteroidota bacterium]